jgi:choloylglycine hydrolase
MRSAKTIILLLLPIILIAHTSAAYGCTTFVLRKDHILLFGRNLDWCTGTGLVIINPRHLQKVALAPADGNPAQWVSKYGSITFNQIGRELPYGGFNEAGLIVEHMTLDQTTYPAADDRATIQATQWIQYQLDNHATVDGVIASDSTLRIAESFSKFHFLVCDQSGRAATIEFLDGRMVPHFGDELPVPVLANSTYEASLDAHRSGEKAPDPSIYHFMTAARMVRDFDPVTNRDPIDYAFNILSSVSQGPQTKWSIVYDIPNEEIHIKVFETPLIQGDHKIFFRAPGVAHVKTIDMKAIDYETLETAQVLALDFDGEGCQNNRFIDYTTSINRESILQAFRFMQAWGVPISVSDEDLVILSKYPESLRVVR